MSKHELEPAEQKPAAWIIRHPRFCGKFTDDKEIAEHWENKEQGCTAPLFLHSQPAPDVALVEAFDAGRRAARAEAAELVDALRAMIDQAQRVSVCGNFSGAAVVRAIDALAAYRQQGGEA